ncbi:hypothetical protein Ddye_029512 [Dipteronia dyeriana]|uniref:RNase H type-1 domain-containing protein n=1 Tax=Dipteronia dyeriana TaxID=168575 RepID=A0AAD9TFU7_9ROSI|nr:hypothetical protein Ddye_029512 [Dipteronia dyeriana]
MANYSLMSTELVGVSLWKPLVLDANRDVKTVSICSEVVLNLMGSGKICVGESLRMVYSLLTSRTDFDWVKLNVDGNMNPILGSITSGGVIKGHKKSWLGGFALNKGTDNVIEAELWGIFEGLKLAWKEGHKKVVVETDS